jgi:RHS repeat-associated protein
MSSLRERAIEILPGQYFDAETGLHQNWHRDYDPGIGRYLQPDPLGLDGGVSLFGYAAQNPLLRTDPTGLYHCTYSVSAHTMSCVPDQALPGHDYFFEDKFVAGNDSVEDENGNGCQNNGKCQDSGFSGPIPLGNYDIGSQNRGSSRRDLTPHPDNTMYGRGRFQIHGCGNSATCSDGCIAATTNPVRDRLNYLLSLEPNSLLTVSP